MFRETIASTFYRNNHNHHRKKNFTTFEPISKSQSFNETQTTEATTLFSNPKSPKIFKPWKVKKTLHFVLGDFGSVVFILWKALYFFFVKITKTWLERDLTHTLHSWKKHSHTQSHTITLHNCLYLLNETKQKKNACLNTIISLYTDTDLCCCW